MNRTEKARALRDATALHARSQLLLQQVRSQRVERRLLAEHRRSQVGYLGAAIARLIIQPERPAL